MRRIWADGDKAVAISDLSGREFPYREMTENIRGMRVHVTELDDCEDLDYRKRPRYIDAIALKKPRPPQHKHHRSQQSAFDPYARSRPLGFTFQLAHTVDLDYHTHAQHPERQVYMFFWDSDNIAPNYEIDSMQVLTDLDGYAHAEIDEVNHHTAILEIPAFTGNNNHRIAIAIHESRTLTSYEYGRPSGVHFNQISTIAMQNKITILQHRFKTFLTGGNMLPLLGGNRIYIGV